MEDTAMVDRCGKSRPFIGRLNAKKAEFIKCMKNHINGLPRK